MVHALHYKSVFLQEAMESFAFPAKINSISAKIPQMWSKLYFFSLESLEYCSVGVPVSSRRGDSSLARACLESWTL